MPIKKGTRPFYQVPGNGVFYQVLSRMNPGAFARLFSETCGALQTGPYQVLTFGEGSDFFSRRSVSNAA